MSRSLNLVSGLYLKISILTIVAGLVLRIVLLNKNPDEKDDMPKGHAPNKAVLSQHTA